MTQPKIKNPERTFGFAKFLSWSSLILVVCSGLFLSVVISNIARQTLLEKQKEFALLLAENLNQQIYRRFTLPTILGMGYIALKVPEQYKRLEQVIQWSTHGLHMREIRIYDNERVVSFSTNKDMIGLEGLTGERVNRALGGEHSFAIVSAIHPFWAIFDWDIKPGSVMLETVYPLRAERGVLPGADEENNIMGVLEMAQDITEDYKTVVRFQWLIISTTLISSLALSFILFMIIRRVDRINAERLAERERLEREMQENEKLASMGRMVASIAHEIRNPLGIIRSSSELLLKKNPVKDDLTSRILKAIFDESKRLSQTVGDFLDYARPKQLKQEPVDLARVLDQALAFLDSEFSKNKVEIERLYSTGLMVLGDKDYLYRAFYNILVNAVQALDGMPGKVTLMSEQDEGRVRVIFMDSGPGVDEAVLPKLLDPFFTTKESGTGLGLAITNNIIKSSQGRLEIANAPEKGAMVTLEFPYLAAQS